MPKGKSIFYCTECGNETPKWQGKCPACGSWNTIVEQAIETKKNSSRKKLSVNLRPHSLKEVEVTKELRFATGMSELDRVLGGEPFKVHWY